MSTAADSALNRDVRSGRFLAGNRANPAGRPKVSRSFRDFAQQAMVDVGWPTLAVMVRGEGEDRRFAIKLLAEYAYGKPSQHVDADVKLGGVVVHLPAREEPKVIEHD